MVETDIKLKQAESEISDLKEQLRSAHEELDKSNSELLQLTMELDSRVEERTTQLKKEHQQKQRYLDIVQVLIMVLDVSGNITLLNKNGCEILGYDYAEIIGKNWINTCIPPETRDKIVSVFNTVISGKKEPFEYYENVVLTKSGDKKIIAWHNVILRDSEENINGILCSGEDVTERKKAEDELKRSENLVRSLLDVTQESFFLLDTKGTILVINKKGAERLGISMDDLIGASAYDIFPPELAESRKEVVDEVIKTGIPAELEDFRGDRVIYNYIEPAINDKGEIFGVGIFAQDITERKNAETALRESEEYLATIFETIPIGLFLIDPVARTIVDANEMAMEMCGFSKDEMIGHMCHYFVCPAEKNKCPIMDLKQVVDKSEKELLTKGGKSIPIFKTVSTVQIKEKDHLLEVFMDITDHKKAEEEIIKLNRELEQRVKDRTAELQKAVNLMAGREVRMAELKEVIKYLRNQIIESGLDPVIDDPLEIKRKL